MANNKVCPQAYICPISLDIMHDPYVDNEGHTFDLKNITQWLTQHQTCPVSRHQLTQADLKPNYALREAIELWRQYKAEKVIQAQPVNQGSSSSSSETNTDLTVTYNWIQDYKTLCVNIVPPQEGTRVPSDVVCVIDTSGSMDDEVTVINEQGTKEANGLSQLDVVKHAVTTVIESMCDHDRLSIVEFNTSASIVHELTPMTANNKTLAKSKLTRLRPTGQTNIWDGLTMALNQMTSQDLRNKNIFLFTDGQPNMDPPRGLIRALEKYIELNSNRVLIHTFGFGYGLNSELLKRMADLGHGSYGYIPDASFVGTIFINGISNMLSTVATNVEVEIPQLGYKHVIGSVQLGMEMNLIVSDSIENAIGLDIIVRYEQSHNPGLLQKKELVTRVTSGDLTDHGLMKVITNLARTKTVKAIENCMDLAGNKSSEIEKAIHMIKLYIQLLNDRKRPQDFVFVDGMMYLKNLLRDLEGEVTKAISRPDWYKRWGQHYLLSLIDAHSKKKCNNFKDPGVQHYGGTLFVVLREQLDTIFNGIPAPKPSLAQKSNGSRGTSKHSASNYTHISSMKSYNYSGGVCFHPDCWVETVNGPRLVRSVKIGDELQTPDGWAKVRFVTKQIVKGEIEMIQFASGLKITPYHPIRLSLDGESEREWVFPANLQFGTKKKFVCDAVYNFVLEKHHSVWVNRYDCATLGHGMNDNAVIEHPYYGTNKVVEDVSKLGVDENGHNVILSEYIQRDETGRVCRIGK